MNSKYTILDCQAYAAVKKGRCVSDKYEAIDKHMLWECEFLHQWLTSFAKIKKGTWCPFCVRTRKHTIEECQTFAASKSGRCRSVTYTDNKQPLEWECLIDGTVWMANFHNVKNGNTWCPACFERRRAHPSNKLSLQNCHEWATSKKGKCKASEYIDAKTLMPWECEHNHEWDASFNNVKNNGTWCPKCITSKPQTEIEAFINSLGYETLFNDRKLIAPLELDIYVIEKKIAIEYCGLHWHGEKMNPDNGRTRHLNKLQTCQKQDIRLLTIFEDEWLLKPEQVKGYLRAILGRTENKIDARRCKIQNVESKLAKQFHNDNHIQGQSNGKHIGLYFEDELVCVATFAIPSASRNAYRDNVGKIELMRYTAKINYSVRGGLSKLLKHFIKTTPGIQEIVSYSDNRWSAGNLYKMLGFQLVTTGHPSYFYFQNNSLDRAHRFNFTKRRALELYGGDPMTETEWSIMSANGWDRIWDCGSTKWVLKIT